MKLHFVRILHSVLVAVCIFILLVCPCVTFGSDLTQPHGTISAQLGGPSYQASTDWQGFNVFGISVQVNIGGDIGGTDANVSMSGSGNLQFSQYPGSGTLSFNSSSGNATMDIGFQTWAKYRIAFAGFQHEGDLPLLPDIANTDLSFSDQQPFNSYMLGKTVTLSDTVDNVQIVNVRAVDSAEFDLPPGLFDISIGISVTPSVTCNLRGVRLDTSLGTFYAPGDTLNVNLNAPTLIISGIAQTTHCDFTAGISPNGTVEVTAFGLWDQTGTLPTGLTVPVPLGSTDISTTPSQSITFNVPSTATAPVITAVSPLALTAATSPQKIEIVGTGFTSSSTLVLNGSAPPISGILAFINANEIDYNDTFASAGTRSVQVINGSQISNSKNFTVRSPAGNTGSLVVNVFPAGIGAQWEVNGTYYNTGNVISALTPGQYTVSFKPVSGYTTPVNQTAMIAANAQTPLSASYTPIVASTYTLTLNYNSAQGGASASPVVNGNKYAAGSLVQLTAVASSGYHFTGWSGDASGSVSPITITMNGNKNVTANFASGDPNLATVRVTIQPQAAATAGVKWGTNYTDLRDSGTSYTTSPGSSFLVLHPVDGWISPIAIDLIPITVTAGETTNVVVTFTQDTTPGLLTVRLSPQDAVTAGARWHVNGGPAQGTGSSLSLAPSGGYAVSFDSVSGWTAPANQIVTVQRGQTTILAGNYAPPVGQPVIGGISPPIGAMAGGTLLTISGVNFNAPATVLVGGSPVANVTVTSGTQITCLTPSSSIYGSAPVVVRTGGGVTTNANGFAYGLVNGYGLSLVSAVGGLGYAVYARGNFVYFGEGRDLVVLDVTTPSSPSPIGRVTLPGIVRDIGIDSTGQYAYVADGEGGLQVVDISKPTAPAIRGYYSSTNFSNGITIFGGLAYVAESSGLEILDLSNHTAPSLLSSIDCVRASDVIVKLGTTGLMAYVTTGEQLCVIDVSDPKAPVSRGQTYMGTGGVSSIAFFDHYVFGASSNDKFIHMVDVSDPDLPRDSRPSAGGQGYCFPTAVVVVGNYLYAMSELSSKGLVAFDINNNTLSYVGQLANVSASEGNAAFAGNQIFFAGGNAGLDIINVSLPFAPKLSGQYNDSGLISGNYSSCAVTGNSLCVPLGGFNVFDVSQPNAPALAATLSAGGSPVEAGNGIAYCAKNTLVGGIQIFNVATPSASKIIYSIDNTVISDGHMQLDGSILYVTGQNPAVQQPRFVAVDVSTPLSPKIVCTKDFPEIVSGGGSFGTGVAVRGSKVIVAMNTGVGVSQLDVLDISDLDNPVEVGSLTNIGIPKDIQMSMDGNYVYEMDGKSNSVLRILDVSVSSHPFFVTNITLDSSEGMALAMRGNELYAASSSALYVLDIASSVAPIITRSNLVSGIIGIDIPSDTVGQGENIYLADGPGGIVILKELDIESPFIIINNPWSFPTYTNMSSSMNLGGGVSDNVGITAITWSNDRGGSGQINGYSDSWYVSGISLYPGTNVLTVTAIDAAGNAGADTLTVIYQTANQNQGITFPPIADHTFSEAPISLVAAASSGLPVTFSVVSGPSMLTSSNVLSLIGAGAVTVQADQAGGNGFYPATPVDLSFNVARANQSIAFNPLPGKSAGDAPFALAATTSSGLPAYFSILSGPATVDTNNVVTLLGAGAVTVIAWQPGNSNYNAAVTVQQSFNVSAIPQTITFGPLSPQKVGDAPFALNVTASSGLLVSFVVSGPAKLSGNIVSLTGWGTVTVTASQAGNSTYAAAAAVTQSFNVAPADNTLVSLGFLTNGGFQMAFYGSVGTDYTLQGSTDLRNWSSLLDFACTNSPTVLADATAGRLSHRFYRVAPFGTGNSGAPIIGLILAGSKVVISWSANAPGFALESTTNLTSGIWATNSVVPVVVNGKFTVTNAVSGQRQFYRLTK